MIGPYREGSPHVADFEAVLDWDAIRAEFSRKAKKIGLVASNDVGFRMSGDGFDFWCEAKGRA
jgi:hypothetical protein